MVLEIQDMAQHFVLTRSGRRESFDGDRICDRINALCEGLQVSAQLVTDRIINGLYDGITTKEIDQFSAMAAANLYLTHPDYTMLAGRILTSNLHRCTPDTFSEAMRVLLKEGILDVSFYKTVHRYKDILDEAIQQSRDFEYNFSGFNVIHSQYLLKDNKGNDVERVQYALMRIAVQIHGDAVDEVLKTYETLSKRHYIHASPVWYNAGTRRNQLQSCFVFDTDDTIEGIYDTLKDMALVGKHCGGIGVRLSRLRGDGSRIASIQGISQGILPLAKVIEASCKYVTQAGKRLGQANVFLDIFHPDIEHFAAAKILSKAANNDQHLNYLWTSICIPDLFMKRLSEAIETKCPQKWSLFQPHHHPQLYDCYGEAFEKLYLELEAADKACHTVDVETLFWTIIQSRSETGAPFIFFTDNVNRCSNQKNIGMIRSSNLCMEICEATNPGEPASCNLASIVLHNHVSEDGQVDYESIQRTAAMAIRNVDSLIDRGFYPFDAIKVQNQNNRPIALGITGLASLFFKLRLPFTSPEAKEINKKVMAAIYYGAVQGSIESAKEHGAYPCFEGSPFSKGQFQFDLAGERPHPDFNWERLRQDMMTHGMRNSLLTGLPPAATTGSASMSTDSFEPNSSNIYNRKLRSGNFALVCEELVEDLMGLGLWNNVMADRIVKNDGSIQNIEGVPQSIKDIYKTVWELSQKDLIDMAVDRGLYVDQAQSLNVFFARPNAKTMSSSTFDAWRKGIKTLYYCRSKAAAEAVKTSLVPALEAPACAIGCDSCGV